MTIRSRRSPSGTTRKPFFLYLGRHIGLPVALEGPEAEGDLVHPDGGLLRRRDEARADRAPRPRDARRLRCDRLARLRQGRLEHPGDEGSRGAGDRDRHGRQRGHPASADDVIYVPKTPAFLQASAILPLQLLAYRIARLKGMNVDQPRNTWPRQSQSSNYRLPL